MISHLNAKLIKFCKPQFTYILVIFNVYKQYAFLRLSYTLLWQLCIFQHVYEKFANYASKLVQHIQVIWVIKKGCFLRNVYGFSMMKILVKRILEDHVLGFL